MENEDQEITQNELIHKSDNLFISNQKLTDINAINSFKQISLNGLKYRHK